MVFRAYGIIDDTEKDVLVMGVKNSDYLSGFLVFFGGRVEEGETGKEGFLRELSEESVGRVLCPADDVHRFRKYLVTEPSPATLFFFRCTDPSYTTGEIPYGGEISSVVAVSVTKLLAQLPDKPEQVTPALVADALISLYGGGADVRGYQTSKTVQALCEYLIEYYYDE
ncbi:NUDIX hydrolase [Actinocorallia populi]|uniref:NUDIX hydrolase n=1 Tax=Actinocorallia populi TaxID=2079200 RepID=UPI000D089C31|nr:NUDIX hydrolase [Actinocorallia populi]